MRNVARIDQTNTNFIPFLHDKLINRIPSFPIHGVQVIHAHIMPSHLCHATHIAHVHLAVIHPLHAFHIAHIHLA
ncbi:hypothetical protein D3C76_1442150 [compost metagenome]